MENNFSPLKMSAYPIVAIMGPFILGRISYDLLSIAEGKIANGIWSTLLWPIKRREKKSLKVNQVIHMTNEDDFLIVETEEVLYLGE